jgi:hypothetical protein
MSNNNTRVANLSAPQPMAYSFPIIWQCNEDMNIGVWINGYTHAKVMSDIGVEQGWPSPPHFGFYDDELETYLDEIDKDSPYFI